MKTLLLFLLILSIVATVALAQQASWYKLAERGDIASLTTLEQNGKLPEPWTVLVQALQANDAKTAQPLYERVLVLDPNGAAGKFAKQRLGHLQTFVAVNLEPSSDALVASDPHVAKSPNAPGVPGEISSAKQPVSINDGTGKFVAQFGSFTKKGTADGIALTLKNHGFSAEVVSIVIGDRKMWRVWSGRFATEKEAAEKISAVKAKTALDGVILRAQ
ncbi:MAG: SPOR domain-containing protein [bacterium]|nr:SPOR domain-containing protein [bacterium]